MSIQTISRIFAQLLKKTRSNLHRYFVKIERKNTAKRIALIRKGSPKNASKRTASIRKESPKNVSKRTVSINNKKNSKKNTSKQTAFIKKRFPQNASKRTAFIRKQYKKNKSKQNTFKNNQNNFNKNLKVKNIKINSAKKIASIRNINKNAILQKNHKINSAKSIALLKNKKHSNKTSAIVSSSLTYNASQDSACTNSQAYNASQESVYTSSLTYNTLQPSTIGNITSNTLQSPLAANSADSAASQNLAEVTSIPALNTSLLVALSPITQLPTKVFVRQPGQPETTIGWWLTVEMLNELIGQFLNGYISRLVLSWGSRELVLLHNKGKHDILLKPNSGTYACLFFDNKNTNWYALVSLPEVYAVVDSKDVEFVPFGLGSLPNYMVHDTTKRIKEQLNEIVTMVANPHGSPAFMTWSPQCYRFETYPRYHIAKRLYGGYSAEQEPCRLNAKFYIPTAPIRLAYANCTGTQSNYAYKPRNKSEVQEALVAYMMGKLSLLILSWQLQKNNSSENSTMPNRHIILVQDQGSHQMLYLDQKYLCFLVSDVSEYMKAEGHHYRKTVFNGKELPAYLVHKDLCRIRDYTDLLLAQIEEPNAILNLFGEFSYHGEDYEEIMKEFFAKERT